MVGDKKNRKSQEHLKEREMKFNTTCSVLQGVSLLGKVELVLAA